MKIGRVGAELFHEERRTDRHDEANSRFSQFASAPQNSAFCPHSSWMCCAWVSEIKQLQLGMLERT